MSSRRTISITMLALSLAALSLSAAAPAVRGAPAPPLPTMAELEAGVRAEAAKQTLASIGRVLAKGDVAALGYDRHRLLLLQAECQLLLRDKPAAIGTWTQVGVLADAQAAIADKAESMAMVTMLKRCSGMNYAPRTGDEKTPIDVVDAASRRRAFQALFTDDLAAVNQEYANAKGAASLGPVRKIAGEFGLLQAEEMLATGGTGKSAELADTLVPWSTRLIGSALGSWADELERVARHADEMVTAQQMNARGKLVKVRRRRGVTGADLAAVQAIFGQSGQLPGDIAFLNGAFIKPIELNGGGRDFANESRRVHDRAQKLLERAQNRDAVVPNVAGAAAGRRGRQ